MFGHIYSAKAAPSIKHSFFVYQKGILLRQIKQKGFEKSVLQYLLVQSAQLRQLLEICIMRFALAIMLCRIGSDYYSLRNKLSELCSD